MLALSALSCVDEPLAAGPDGGPEAPGASDELLIAVPDPTTRTLIEEDEGGTAAGQQVRIQWADGDRFRLWWRSEQEQEIAPLADFTHRDHINDNDASRGRIFRAKDAALPAEADTYTYYALSPLPAEASQTTAWFDIPTEQDGTYGACDILWARLESDKRLRFDVLNELNFRFGHLLHALKITLPETGLNDKAITALRVEFPQPVAGRLSVDIESGEAQLEPEGASNGITVRFAEPKLPGDPFWVFLAPETFDGGTVRFIATDGAEYSYPLPTEDLHSLQAGHITPVTITGFDVRHQTPFTIEVTDHSKLGEPATLVSELTLPDGYIFPGLEMSPHLFGAEPTASESETFVVMLYADVLVAMKKAGEQMTMRLESKHAEDFEFAVPVDENRRWQGEMPYLFFEDFSGVGTFHNEDEFSTSSTGNNHKYGPFLGGWTGGRIGGMAGVAIRIACRRETAVNNMAARVDSPPMRHIKDGVSVRIAVGYDYGMDRWGNGFSGIFWREGRNGGEDYSQTVHLGYVRDANNTAYASGDETMDMEITNFSIKEVAPSGDQNAGYNNITHKDGAFEVPDCDNTTRLTWRTTPQNGGGANNNTFWFYIDNVRVSIVPQD